MNKFYYLTKKIRHQADFFVGGVGFGILGLFLEW